ncbi:GspH/FimT family pseudopilin [Solimonas soli]|uniref:GspH/FimT family pseudopilin n=1 Tax=Solimonas soli TaxID=413479 RepID=UPI0012F7A761|nr:GspH/FimT family pseudopilin [Solimonas soli]
MDGQGMGVRGRRKQHCRRGQAGWSVLEVLTTAAIVSVSMGIAIPAVQGALAQNRRAAASNQLQLALLSARQMAVTRNSAMTFCAGSAAEGCHGDWTRKEWIIFSDRDHDGNVDDDEPLTFVDRLSSSSSLEIAGNGPFRRAVVFRESGAAETVTGAFAAGTLRICIKKAAGTNATDLLLIGSGRAEPTLRNFAGNCPAP